MWQWLWGLISSPCQHDWEEKVKETMPSVEDRLNAINKTTGVVPTQYNKAIMNFQRKFIVIMSCKKCGKLVKFVELHPGG